VHDFATLRATTLTKLSKIAPAKADAEAGASTSNGRAARGVAPARNYLGQDHTRALKTPKRFFREEVFQFRRAARFETQSAARGGM